MSGSIFKTFSSANAKISLCHSIRFTIRNAIFYFCELKSQQSFLSNQWRANVNGAVRLKSWLHNHSTGENQRTNSLVSFHTETENEKKNRHFWTLKFTTVQIDFSWAQNKTSPGDDEPTNPISDSSPLPRTRTINPPSLFQLRFFNSKAPNHVPFKRFNSEAQTKTFCF